jgi:hypothetical protein
MTSRSIFRLLRWAALGGVAPVLWACQARTLEKPELKPSQTYLKTFAQAVNRNVDLLFMVDDSSSMRLSQTNLLNNFPTFMTALQSAPQGLPNIHVAVVSSDMGAGYGDIAGCTASGGQSNPGGDRGVFQYTARGTCTATNLQPGATFISNVGGQANYTGNLADVFTCIAALGENGCGFEHQFGSVLRALGADGMPPPQENQGFLRPEAYLVVVFITNEDDCSSAVEPQFFDIQSNWNQGSQLGESFRCNEFGHLCTMGGGAPMHPSRTAPNNDVTATVNYDSCVSDDTSGYLLSVKDTADRLKALKSDPSQVLVAMINGPATPYQVHWKAPSMADTSCGAASCPWPEITHSCTDTADMSFADPGVREAQLASEFGSNGLVLSICDTSFAPSLGQIANLINAALVPPCIPGTVANKTGTTDPDCTVISHTSNGSGGTIDSTVPYCGSNGAAAPCWQLMAGTCTGGGTGQIVSVSQDPSVSTSTAQNATVNCALQ